MWLPAADRQCRGVRQTAGSRQRRAGHCESPERCHLRIGHDRFGMHVWYNRCRGERTARLIWQQDPSQPGPFRIREVIRLFFRFSSCCVAAAPATSPFNDCMKGSAASFHTQLRDQTPTPSTGVATGGLGANFGGGRSACAAHSFERTLPRLRLLLVDTPGQTSPHTCCRRRQQIRSAGVSDSSVVVLVNPSLMLQHFVAARNGIKVSKRL